MKPLNLCFVSQEYPPETGGGGIGTETYLRARGLTARGHTVHVVSASWDKEDRAYPDQGATIHRIGKLNVPWSELTTYWLAYSEAVASKIIQLEKTIQFDIIQFAEYAAEGFVYQTDCWNCRNAKFVVQMHGSLAMLCNEWKWPERGSTGQRVGCFMEEMTLRCADKLLASTRHTADYCQRAYGVDTSAAAVVYSGVDAARFRPRPAPNDERSPRILFVGGLSTEKGFADLLHVTARLKGRFPRIMLRGVGRVVPAELALFNQIIDELGIADHVEIVGYVGYEQLPAHYAWCEIFAAPSIYEGGPGNVYLEAMSCAKPVIACTTGGVHEVVEHLKTGVLVQPRDCDAIEAAALLLIEDPALRHRMGAEGRRHVEQQFTVEKFLDRFERHYQELL